MQLICLFSLFLFFLKLFFKILTLGTLSYFTEAASVRSKLLHVNESKMIFLCSLLRQQLVPFMQ